VYGGAKVIQTRRLLETLPQEAFKKEEGQRELTPVRKLSHEFTRRSLGQLALDSERQDGGQRQGRRWPTPGGVTSERKEIGGNDRRRGGGGWGKGSVVPGGTRIVKGKNGEEKHQNSSGMWNTKQDTIQLYVLVRTFLLFRTGGPRVEKGELRVEGRNGQMPPVPIQSKGSPRNHQGDVGSQNELTSRNYFGKTME